MEIKPLIWVGSAKDDFRSLPEGAMDEIGYALHQAQLGGKSEKAKPFKGFGHAAVLEIVEYNTGGTYRAVYTVKFKEAVAVLHVFQKKSTRGIKTSKQDIELIKSRFIPNVFQNLVSCCAGIFIFATVCIDHVLAHGLLRRLQI